MIEKKIITIIITITLIDLTEVRTRIEFGSKKKKKFVDFFLSVFLFEIERKKEDNEEIHEYDKKIDHDCSRWIGEGGI